MLKIVRQVSAGLVKDIGGGRTYTLETIAKAVEAYSPIDEIVYLGYDVGPDNPIWGQFRKYGRQPTVYAGQKTFVEVRYATHLDIPWKRFVVCKELCHSLETDEGNHSVTDRAVERIISYFSMVSTSKINGRMSAPINAEILAEIGAIELLCPMQERSALIAEHGGIDQLCKGLQIPSAYRFAFEDAYMGIIEDL
jgi:hypothetical protein